MIKIENVSYTYQSKYQTVQAVKNATYSFEPGVMYAITGRSGSGKSTLLSLLAGLDLPTSGTICVDGEDIRSINRDVYRMKKASMIYQAFHLFPLLTVMENVTFPMEIQKLPGNQAKERAASLLEKVGLKEDTWHKFPHMLSGGEQQRAAVARAVAAGGRIILADEPTGNLDSENEAVIIELLKGLTHEDGYVVIVVTHNDTVAEAADAVLKMSDGELSEVRNDCKK